MSIDQRLLESSFVVGDTQFSTILLKNDSRFFWLMVVPRNKYYSELFDFSDDDYHFFMDEIKKIAYILKEYTLAHKINVETLGNVVPMMHVHIIARFTHDCCWPKPVWLVADDAVSYTQESAQKHIDNLKKILNL